MPGPGSCWVGEEELREVLDVMRSGHLSRYGSLDDPGFAAVTTNHCRPVAAPARCRSSSMIFKISS